MALIFPLALLVAMVPETTAASTILAGALAIAAIGDAVFAPRQLEGVSLNLPAVVRMSKGREGKLDVQIGNRHTRGKELRVALALPSSIHSHSGEMDVVLPPRAGMSQILWKCAPSRRGKYHIAAAYIEVPSYMGFWGARKVIPLESEIRVYPDLMTERKNLASLFLKRGAAGLHVHRQIGKGRDFEKLREYAPGDSFDEIHWKATARRGRPITKVFQIERTQEVYVVIDASRLSSRETTSGSSVLERHITAALVLGLATEQQGDLFGLLSFSDKVETFVRARNGRAHYSACRDALYTLQPKTVSPDFDELCSFIRLRMRRRALMVFLTSLDDPAIAESFVRNIDLICRHHVVLVNMIRQPSTSPMFQQPDVESIDDLYRQVGSHLRWTKLQQLEHTLRRRGVMFSLIENERASSEVVSRYLNVKKRQLL